MILDQSEERFHVANVAANFVESSANMNALIEDKSFVLSHRHILTPVMAGLVPAISNEVRMCRLAGSPRQPGDAQDEELDPRFRGDDRSGCARCSERYRLNFLYFSRCGMMLSCPSRRILSAS